MRPPRMLALTGALALACAGFATLTPAAAAPAACIWFAPYTSDGGIVYKQEFSFTWGDCFKLVHASAQLICTP